MSPIFSLLFRIYFWSSVTLSSFKCPPSFPLYLWTKFQWRCTCRLFVRTSSIPFGPPRMGKIIHHFLFESFESIGESTDRLGLWLDCIIQVISKSLIGKGVDTQRFNGFLFDSTSALELTLAMVGELLIVESLEFSLFRKLRLLCPGYSNHTLLTRLH